MNRAVQRQSRLRYAIGFALSIFVTIEAHAERLFSTAIPRGVVDSLDSAGERFSNRAGSTRVVFPLPVRDRVLQVQLEPSEIRAPNYRAVNSGGSGRSASSPLVRLFRGSTGTEDSDSFTRFAIYRDPKTNKRELLGYVREGEVFYRIDQDNQDDEVFHVSSLTAQEADLLVAECGSNETHHVGGAALTFSQSAPATSGLTTPPVGENELRVVEIATEADIEFVSQEGGPTQANARVLAILNAVDAIYRAQLGARLAVTFQHTWTAGDPYVSTDAGSMLDEFVSYWNLNFSGTQVYDVAHLWTGKDLNGSTIGIAYVGALCGGFRYGLSERQGAGSLDVPLTAHELGHNFGSDHDATCSSSSWVMCAFLQANANVFSAASRSQISSHVGSVSCLATDSGGGGGGGGGGVPPNSPPVLAPIGTRTVQESSTLTFTLTATDPDGDSVTFGASPLPNGANLAGATFAYTPAQGTVPGGSASSSVAVTFTGSDGRGGVDSEAVTITVLKNNRAPSISNPGTASVAEGVTFTRQLQASDPDGDPLRFFAPAQLPPGAVLSATGLFSWRPAGNQSGNYSIAVAVRDDFGGSTSSTLTLTVTNTPGVPELPLRHALGDFSGSGKAALSVFRTFSGVWYSSDSDRLALGQYDEVQFGLPGDVTVPGDYNGDRITDHAVFRPSESRWYVRYSGTGAVSTFQFGLSNDVPVPADYDGDGRTDYGVYRGSIGAYIYRASSSTTGADTVVSIGQQGDLPVPCNYDSDAAVEFAVFRPGSATWFVANGGPATTVLGAAGDIPVPGDYNSDGTCEKVVWRPSTGEWISSASTIQFGLGGDVPVPADYDGDGDLDIAVFRPSQALWYLRMPAGNANLYQLGLFDDVVSLRESFYFSARLASTGGPLARGDGASALWLYRRTTSSVFAFGITDFSAAALIAPVGSYVLQGDYDGDGLADRAAFNAGFWTFSYGNGGQGTGLWGVSGDIPVVGDFDGDGQSDIAVFRPADTSFYSAWYIINSRDGSVTVRPFGLQGDQPIPGDFNGDGWTDIAVFRPSSGFWYVLDSRSGWLIQAVQWGLPGDVVRVADFNSDGRADKIAWRAGIWYVYESSGLQYAVQWGLSGDVPVPGRFAALDATDFAVYRPVNATLYVLTRAGVPLTRATGLTAQDQVVGVQPPLAIR